MMLMNSKSKYGSIAKLFHWVIFILVAGMLAVGFLLDDVPKEYKSIVYNAHKVTGVVILFLMVLRFIWMIVNVKPGIEMQAKWQRIAERLVHAGMYVALIAMPLTGWIGSSSAGKAPHIGDWKWQLPVEKSQPLISSLFDFHEWIAYGILGLLVLHIAAALFHHYYLKDDVLKRMMP